MRFLFCSLETPGFLYPTIAIAQQLKARGHDIAFVADVKCSGFLAAWGLKRIQRGANDGSSFQVAQWAKPLSVAIQVKHIEYALESFRADVLVGQSLTLGPLVVAQKRQLRVALLGFCTYLWPRQDVVDASLVQPETDGRARWRYAEMIGFLNQTRQLFRLPQYEGSCRETPLLGDLFLVRSVPELEVNFAQLPSHVHLVGSCLWEPEGADPEMERWLTAAAKSNMPVIYVQHGRFFHIPSFWPKLAEALEGLNCLVAASSGRLDTEVPPMPVGSLVRPHLPQGPILRVASTVVASANTTAVLGALEAGIPSLLIPGGGEQLDVAELVSGAGVAKYLSPEDVTTRSIGEAVQELLTNQTYRERAEYYKTAFSRIDGIKRAADLIERLALTQSLVLRTEESVRSPWSLSSVEVPSPDTTQDSCHPIGRLGC